VILCAWNTSALAMAEVYRASLPQNQDCPTRRGPVFKAPETKDNPLILHFETMSNKALKITGTPVRFVLAGEDERFREVQVELVGKTSVAVWSDKVSKPVAARFAWADRAYIDSWAESGLPTNPFRTDNWPMWRGGEGPFASEPPGLQRKFDQARLDYLLKVLRRACGTCAILG
jgi:hypothetical protein